MVGGIPGAIVGAAIGVGVVGSSKALAAVTNRNYLNLSIWAKPKEDPITAVQLQAKQTLAHAAAEDEMELELKLQINGCTPSH